MTAKPKPWRFRVTLWDLLAGLPAGLLVFMSTVLLTTLTSLRTSVPIFLPLFILVIVSLGVGILAGITRLRQGPATGLAAGVTAALIFGYLWLAAAPGDQFNPLVIGPVGMVNSIVICPLGGFLGARLRKAL